MDVPFVDLHENYEDVKQDVDQNISEVIDQTQFIGGEQVETFETDFGDYLGAEHAVAVNSGTDALRLSLEALGVGAGDEVVTVSHTWISSVDGIVHNGARPRFVDVDPDEWVIDTDKLTAAINDDTEAILPVHLYGTPVDMETIRSVAAEHNLAIVEDACQAHGAEYDGEMCGTLGDVGCFSFYPSKNLGAFGDAGIVVTDDADLARRVRRLREYGSETKHEHMEVGYNSRMDTIQAAVLNAKLDRLDAWNEARTEIARQYRDGLADTPLQLPTIDVPNASRVFHLFVVRARSETERDALQQHLEERGIDTGIHYPEPVHELPAYEALEYEFTDLDVTEQLTGEILSLPIFPEMTESQCAYVVEEIESFYA